MSRKLTLGDRLQLKVALRNIIINAIEASPANEIVDVIMDVDGDLLHICVQNFGAGMTEQEITSSFKFFTITKKESDGMGLGVLIAQKVIYFDYGGEIRYESEIGTIPMECQKQILRFIELKEIRPVGADHTEIVDVRIIAATNQDLKVAVKDGNFRADLRD
ncbi:MAG: sigma 54-interacting transcriptional regulator [Candidatus Electryoneaceae bacterium]|nr:sigma 54-interacting transcriptional regulator [Candidatus Electryoneaceae bacterium]